MEKTYEDGFKEGYLAGLNDKKKKGLHHCSECRYLEIKRAAVNDKGQMRGCGDCNHYEYRRGQYTHLCCEFSRCACSNFTPDPKPLSDRIIQMIEKACES